MGDGYFAYSGNGSYSSASWYDEFNVNLGAALQPAVHRRLAERGLPAQLPERYRAGQSAGNGPQTVRLGGTFHKILGTQDPRTNNGQAVTSVTLNAADGLVLTDRGRSTRAWFRIRDCASSVDSRVWRDPARMERDH